jgi:hypothetical protein
VDDVLLRAPLDGEDPPAVQEFLDATEWTRTLALESIEQMNSRLAEHINAHRHNVQFQMGDSVLFPHRTSACQTVPPVLRSLHHSGLVHF